MSAKIDFGYGGCCVLMRPRRCIVLRKHRFQEIVLSFEPQLHVNFLAIHSLMFCNVIEARMKAL
jgi:hypothetical protein